MNSQVLSKTKLIQALTSVSVLSLTTLLSVVGWNPTTPLEMGSPAYAGQPTRSVRWVPSRKMGSVSSTLSGGRRGSITAACQPDNRAKETITLLVPKDNASLLTTSSTPTLFWYINTPGAALVQFILSDPEIAEPIFTQSLAVEKTGIMRMELPAATPLKIGTRYRWAVLVSCEGAPSQEVYTRSFIERIENPTLQQQATGKSALEKATMYAAAGLWYDALNSLVLAYQQEPENQQVAGELKSLLAQAGNQPLQETLVQNLSWKR